MTFYALLQIPGCDTFAAQGNKQLLIEALHHYGMPDNDVLGFFTNLMEITIEMDTPLSIDISVANTHLLLTTDFHEYTRRHDAYLAGRDTSRGALADQG